MKSKVYAVAHFCLAWLARVVFLVFGKGHKNEPRRNEGAYLVCSNHISALDPIVICAVLRRQQPRFMAKAELFKVPVLGWIVKQLGAYPIDRSGANAGVIFQTMKMLEEGYSVGMFPQGTRRKGVAPSDTPIKAGAGLICEKTHIQVLPIHIKPKGYAMKALRPVKVIVGKPITYEEYTNGGENATDARAITQYIFNRICELGSEDGKADNK